MAQRILLGVTGGIAVYKAAELARFLVKEKKAVRVIMTNDAKKFVTPLTFQALTGHPIYDELFKDHPIDAMVHIELAKWADLLIIVPATASALAHLVMGDTPQLLYAVALAFEKKIWVVPSMNRAMWTNQATQHNVETLRQRGFHIIDPEVGAQACGDFGMGRMVEPEAIWHTIHTSVSTQSLQGVRVLITAGPTQEPIDAVRYISNRSSGKMGYALAKACSELGAHVTLISGPVAIEKPKAVNIESVNTTKEMYEKVMAHIQDTDIFIANAAVSDYTPSVRYSHKIKRTEDTLVLTLHKTFDILTSVTALANKPYTVGFAAETHQVREHAKKKFNDKFVDMLVVNDVSRNDIGFNANENECLVLTKNEEKLLPKTSKEKLAFQLADQIANHYRLTQLNKNEFHSQQAVENSSV